MVSKYGKGNYGINNYSANTTFTDIVTVTAAATLTAAAAIIASGDGIVSGLFALTSTAAIIASGDALASGLFSLDAQNSASTQQLGEATITAAFSMAALGSAAWAEPMTAISASFVISMEYFAGDFWNAEMPTGFWTPEPPLPPSVWAKETPNSSPWRF